MEDGGGDLAGGVAITKRSAERITGLDIELVGGRWVATENGEHVSASASRKSGLAELVDMIYRIRSEQVRRQQNYRCFDCFRVSPLEIDHVIARGTTHGRDDRRGNLRAACLRCHRERHDPRRPRELRPHPEILKLMSKVGLQWGGTDAGWIPKMWGETS